MSHHHHNNTVNYAAEEMSGCGGFCARVVFWHVVQADTAREVTVGQGNHATYDHPHLHTRTCTTVQGLVNVLREARIRDHLVGETAAGERFSARSFFWVDMHGVPCTTHAPGALFDELWELLGLHPTTVQHMNRVLEMKTKALVQGTSEHVFEEVDMDEPDTVHLLPLSHAGEGNYYYVAMQLATVMEKTRPCSAEELRWVTTDQTTSPFPANTSMHAFVASHNITTKGNANGSHITEPTSTTGEANTMNEYSRSYNNNNNIREMECWNGGEDEEEEEENKDKRDALNAMHKTPVATTHVLCFPQGCLTWCPSSTVGTDSTTGNTTTEGQRKSACLMTAHYNNNDDAQHVKDWDKLQEAVFSRLRGNAPAAMTTADFVSLMLSTMCYGYLPDTTAALSEVDSIDATLPTVIPEREKEQAAMLYRVLVQRRRLSVLRKLLFRKLRLLEQLDKPAMRTLAGFMSGIAPRTTHMKRAQSDSHFALSTYDTVVQLVRKLDSARIVMGNLTLVYTSAVTTRNSRGSTQTDMYMLILQYMIIVVLPLSMIASHWGMNCNVPWSDVDNLKPFWGLFAVMVGSIAITLIYPTWAYNTGRTYLIM